MLPIKIGILATLLSSCSVAAVVVDDARFFVAGFGAPGEQFLGLSQSIPHGEGAFVFSFLSNDELTTVVSYASIAELCKLFVVPEGTIFDATYVASHSAFASNDNNPGSGVLSYSSSNLVLAYWDDRSIWSGGVSGAPDENDLYGWVEISQTLNASGDGIVWSAVDGATAVGHGIVTGTYTQIPEPQSYSVLASAIALIAFCHKRKVRGPSIAISHTYDEK